MAEQRATTNSSRKMQGRPTANLKALPSGRATTVPSRRRMRLRTELSSMRIRVCSALSRGEDAIDRAVPDTPAITRERRFFRTEQRAPPKRGLQAKRCLREGQV